MKKCINYIIFKNLISNILLTIFFISFICVLAVFLNTPYDKTSDISQIENNTSKAFVLMFVIYFLFIGSTFSFITNFIYYINKTFLHKEIYEYYGINWKLILFSFLPILGFILDLIIIKKTMIKYKNSKMSDLFLNFPVLRYLKLTISILSSFLFSILNVVFFLVNSISLFGKIGNYLFILSIAFQYLGVIVFFISLIIAFCFWLTLFFRAENNKRILKINNKEYILDYLFFPWIISSKKINNKHLFAKKYFDA